MRYCDQQDCDIVICDIAVRVQRKCLSWKRNSCNAACQMETAEERDALFYYIIMNYSIFGKWKPQKNLSQQNDLLVICIHTKHFQRSMSTLPLTCVNIKKIWHRSKSGISAMDKITQLKFYQERIIQTLQKVGYFVPMSRSWNGGSNSRSTRMNHD